MNEQIEKIYDEACLGSALMLEAEFCEKFAQLIIQKCVQQIDQVKQTKAEQTATEYTQGFDHGMVIAIKTIKECFGVNE
jgi:predicted transcriptional regulator